MHIPDVKFKSLAITNSHFKRSLVYLRSCHMPDICQVLEPLSGLRCVWYMQGPFQFNLAISTAKNIELVWHTYWYDIPQIAMWPKNNGVRLAYITMYSPMSLQMGLFCILDNVWCMCGIWHIPLKHQPKSIWWLPWYFPGISSIPGVYACLPIVVKNSQIIGWTQKWIHWWAVIN